jgi:hypothetical protein
VRYSLKGFPFGTQRQLEEEFLESDLQGSSFAITRGSLGVHPTKKICGLQSYLCILHGVAIILVTVFNPLLVVSLIVILHCRHEVFKQSWPLKWVLVFWLGSCVIIMLEYVPFLLQSVKVWDVVYSDQMNQTHTT